MLPWSCGMSYVHGFMYMECPEEADVEKNRLVIARLWRDGNKENRRDR